MENNRYNILVPTDFSIYSDYAFEAACKIAKLKKATLHIYHSAEIPDDWEDLSAEQRYKDLINKQRAIEAGTFLKDLKSKAEALNIDCQYHFTGGSYIQNIDEVLAKVKVDLIVMGAHGKTKNESMLGSQTIKTLRKVNIPILIVKNKVEQIQFERVAFASGLHQMDQRAFKKFLSFLSPFNVKEVHIVSIDTTSFFSQPTIIMQEALKDFKSIGDGFNVKTHFYQDYSVMAGIRHFVDSFSIGLIGINNHIKHPIKRIFQGSNVEGVVVESKIPVLSIDY